MLIVSNLSQLATEVRSKVFANLKSLSNLKIFQHDAFSFQPVSKGPLMKYQFSSLLQIEMMVRLSFPLYYIFDSTIQKAFNTIFNFIFMVKKTRFMVSQA